jgi:16S rRNA (guanine966-N2)-methyltransferase
MRVIAGYLGGRNFESPKGHKTHPMSDKVRGALFGTLGDIKGLTVLDAFSGSGALSFEAVSRGAKSALALDVDSQAAKIIEQNIVNLNQQDKIQVIRANVKSWSKRNQNEQYDLVLCDPPYDDVQIELVEKLANHLVAGGVMVMSLPPGIRVIVPEWLTLLTHKKYGDAELIFYKRT